MGGKRDEDCGMYRDLLLEPYYVYRDNDPKKYGFKKLQALGYFSGKPRGGKRKSAAIQT